MMLMRVICAILIVFLGTMLSTAQSDADIPANLVLITAENVNQLEAMLTINSQSDIIAIYLGDEQLTWLTSRDSVLHTFDLATHQQTANSLYEFATFAEFSRDGTLLACNCDNGNPLQHGRVIDVQTGEDVFTTRVPLSDFSFNSDNTQLLTASGGARASQAFQLWDLEQQSPILTRANGEYTIVVAISADNNYLAMGYRYNIRVIDLTPPYHTFTVDQYICPCKYGTGLVSFVGDVIFSNDSTRVASMSPDGLVWVSDTESGQLEYFLRDGSMSIDPFGGKFSSRNSDILFSPQDDFIITANGEEMRVWSMSDGDLLRTIYENTSRIAFNPAGTFLASTDGEGTLTLWGIPED